MAAQTDRADDSSAEKGAGARAGSRPRLRVATSTGKNGSLSQPQERNGADRRNGMPTGPKVSGLRNGATRPIDSVVLPESVVVSPTVIGHQWYRRIVKPGMDRVGGTCLLVVMAPLMLLVALLIRLRLGRGVLFRQQRVGLGGDEFTIYKFRTMRPDRRGDLRRPTSSFDGAERRRTHKSEDDPRHTVLGRFLRKFSIDELPQLLNVVNGDMSLVGPRPELVEVAMTTGIVDHPRHLVRPGLTGPWQISPARGHLIAEGLDLDIEYLAQCSLITDFRILALTVPAVWRRTGS